MATEQIRITDEQRKSLKQNEPTMADICTLGETKCIDGNVYVCQTGSDMKPDWFFTNELCENFRSEVHGDVVITTQTNLVSTSQNPVIAISGTIGESMPKVWTVDMKSTIQEIVGAKCNVAGVAKFSGKATTILVLEFWASGRVGYKYQGNASCTVILK